MKRPITQPCVVLGSADRATLFRDELQRRGVRFISHAPSVGRLRRQLVLGEDTSLIICVLLSVDDLKPADRIHIARLLDDRRSFATRVFCVGVVHESESFTRWAPLGCDAYVSSPRAALEAIRSHVQAVGGASDAMTAQQLLRTVSTSSPEGEAVTARTSGAMTAPAADSAHTKQRTRARSVTSASEARRGDQPPP